MSSCVVAPATSPTTRIRPLQRDHFEVSLEVASADEVEDALRAAAIGQPVNVLHPAVRSDQRNVVTGHPRFAHPLQLPGRAARTDDARAAQAGELDRGGADAAGHAMDEDRFTGEEAELADAVVRREVRLGTAAASRELIEAGTAMASSSCVTTYSA
jgi:hypothetical protein